MHFRGSLNSCAHPANAEKGPNPDEENLETEEATRLLLLKVVDMTSEKTHINDSATSTTTPFTASPTASVEHGMTMNFDEF